MKTVSLIYGYSARNAGDFAITLGAIDVLLQEGYRIKLFSRYCRKNQDFLDSKKMIEKRYGDKIQLFESPFNLNRTDSLFKTIRNYAHGVLTLSGIIPDRAFKNALLDSEAVIFNGGNLFRCHSFIDFTRLCALLYPLKLAGKNKKKYIIFPQSASTLNRAGKNLLLPVIQKAEIAFFREPESFKYINKFIDASNFRQTIDLAFFIDKKQVEEVVPDRKSIAITLRFHTVGDISYLPQEKIDRVFDEIGEIVKTLADQYRFVVVVQTEKDEENSRKFVQQHGLELIRSNDPIELISIYKRVDMLIGMRLHSIILALSVGTPCFGVFYQQWGLKNPGLMEYFGMPYLMLDDKTTTISQELPVIQDILNQRKAYSERILNTVEKEHKNMKKVLRGITL